MQAIGSRGKCLMFQTRQLENLTGHIFNNRHISPFCCLSVACKIWSPNEKEPSHRCPPRRLNFSELCFYFTLHKSSFSFQYTGQRLAPVIG